MLTHFLDLLAAVISVTSLLIVTYGALIGIISFLKNEIRRFTGGYSITNIRKLRATFGTYLLLGLEFLIASDILQTVLEPTLNELALLGGIVVLRTILSVFLNKEIKELESEDGEELKQRHQAHRLRCQGGPDAQYIGHVMHKQRAENIQRHRAADVHHDMNAESAQMKR